MLSHASATRLQLRKGRAEERICKVIDSPEVRLVHLTLSLSSSKTLMYIPAVDAYRCLKEKRATSSASAAGRIAKLHASARRIAKNYEDDDLLSYYFVDKTPHHRL